MISGFVIIGSAQQSNAIKFIFARFNRLFPGLVISMILVLLVGSHFIHPYEKPFMSFVNSIFLTYQALGVQPLASPLWTLIIEVKFYFGIAIALLIFPKLFRSAKGIISLLMLWELFIIILQNSTSSIGIFLLPFITLNGSKDLFALGICFNLSSKVKARNREENLLLLLTTLYFVNKVFLVFQNSLILSLYMSIASILIVFSPKIRLTPLLEKFTYWLGLSSYLIYLLHEHLGMALILQIQSHFSNNIFFVVGLAITIITLFSVLVALFIEKPIQKFLKSRAAVFI